LNWIYGLGSFTIGDWVGGLIVGGTELTGTIFYIVGIMNPIETEVEYGVGSGRDYYTYTDYSTNPLQFVGIGLQVAAIIYGHIRPFQYDKALAKKNGTYYAYNPLEHINVALLPVRNGRAGVRLSYSLQF
jgi:hypothetical protein